MEYQKSFCQTKVSQCDLRIRRWKKHNILTSPFLRMAIHLLPNIFKKVYRCKQYIHKRISSVASRWTFCLRIFTSWINVSFNFKSKMFTWFSVLSHSKSVKTALYQAANSFWYDASSLVVNRGNREFIILSHFRRGFIRNYPLL